MSHNKERNEKKCLNCNAVVHGRFCHECGQENIEPKESFWHLVTHFTYDVTHFDGKFFSTLKSLLFKPGFLSKEYLRGRRASYLHPIRMYVFASAIFFFVYFAINKNEKLNKDEQKNISKSSVLTPDSTKQTVPKPLTGKDSVEILPKDTSVYKYQPSSAFENKVKFHAGKMDSKDLVTIDFNEDNDTYAAKKKGSSVLKKIINDYKNNSEEIHHMVPKVMFCTLPLVALSLMLLYRRRKDLFYVNHVILIIHLFTAIFILYLVKYLFDFIGEHFWQNFFSILSGLMTWIIVFYVYRTLRNFYGQKRFKTFIKCCLLFSFFWIIFIIVYSIFVSPIFLF